LQNHPKKENQKLGSSNKLLPHLATLQANAHYVQVLQLFKTQTSEPQKHFPGIGAAIY
jgi:hypothetical protein